MTRAGSTRFATGSRRLATGLALAGLLMAPLACSRAEPEPTDALISIDGELIPAAAFDAYLRENVGAPPLDLDDAAMSGLFDRFLEGQLLLRLAIERGLIEPETLELSTTGALEPDAQVRDALAALLRAAPTAPISDAELRGAYAANRSEFSHPERVRVRQILIEDRGRAREAMAELEQGESFPEVAARFSEGPTAATGGDQGLLARDDLPERFAEIVFALEPGEISSLVDAEYGFQIFQVVERSPARRLSFEEAAPTLRRRLAEGRAEEQIGALLAEALDRYNVDLFPSNLSFAYRGSHADPPDTDPLPIDPPRDRQSSDATE